MCFTVLWTRVQVQTVRPLIQRAMIPGRTGKLNQQQSGWTHRRTTWTRSPAQVTLTSSSTPLANLLFDCETLVSMFHGSEWVHHWLLITISYWSGPGAHQPWDSRFKSFMFAFSLMTSQVLCWFHVIYGPILLAYMQMTSSCFPPWNHKP